MKQLNSRFVVLGIVAVIAIGIAVYLLRATPKTGMTYVSEQERRKGPCPGKEEKFESEGKSYRLINNYYACNKVERGDLVYLRFAETVAPVVRRAHGVPGDKFKIERDNTHHAWNILINHKMLVDANQQPHFFGGENPSVLSLYEKQGAELKAGNYIVFAETSPGRSDSGNLGVVNSDDFLGKVEEISK